MSEEIKNNLLNISIKAMKENFLALDDNMKQREFCNLLDEKQQLQQENKELKDKLKKYENKDYDEANLIADKLLEQQNWNKLEEYCKNYASIIKDDVDMFKVYKTFQIVLNKMQEIKGSDKSE